MKTCRRCGQELPISEFEFCRDSKSKSGRVYLRGQCRKCRRGPGDSAGAVERAHRWKRKNAEKVRIHRRVQYAIATGKLVRRPCERCGATDAVAHHEDYTQPLTVMFLCRRHHGERHRELRSLKH